MRLVVKAALIAAVSWFAAPGTLQADDRAQDSCLLLSDAEAAQLFGVASAVHQGEESPYRPGRGATGRRWDCTYLAGDGSNRAFLLSLNLYLEAEEASSEYGSWLEKLPAAESVPGLGEKAHFSDVGGEQEVRVVVGAKLLSVRGTALGKATAIEAAKIAIARLSPTALTAPILDAAACQALMVGTWSGIVELSKDGADKISVVHVYVFAGDGTYSHVHAGHPDSGKPYLNSDAGTWEVRPFEQPNACNINMSGSVPEIFMVHYSNEIQSTVGMVLRRPPEQNR